MFDQFLQVVTLLLTVAGSIVTTLYGFKAVTKNFDSKLSQTTASLHEALRGKVDIAIYAAKTKELHDANNALALKLAETEREVHVLNELLTLFMKR